MAGEESFGLLALSCGRAADDASELQLAFVIKERFDGHVERGGVASDGRCCCCSEMVT